MVPDNFTRTLLVGRVQRIARDGVRTATMDGCRNLVPAVEPTPNSTMPGRRKIKCYFRSE